MQARAKRSGFTLIELLIVVVIIGILAAIAVPKFSYTKGKAYTSSMKSDLRNLAVAQEGYFFTNNTYTNVLANLNMSASPGVTLTFVTANATGWSASATHANANPITCAIFIGGAPALVPATQPGIVTCQ